MEEKVNLTENGQPEPLEEGLPTPEEDTTQIWGNKDSAFIEVKFNKEIKKLSLDEAATLAQKGMKYDLVADDFERLKGLAKGEGITVSEYIRRLDGESSRKRLDELTDKCSGDKELAQKILKAEKSEFPDEMEILQKEFPEMSYDSLPNQVKTAAEIKGTGLLFEYLLYEHRQRVAAAEELSRQEMTADASLGSLSSGISRNTADAEFLKGVWGR